MEISESIIEHYVIVSVTGRIDSYTAPQFSDSLKALHQRGAHRIIINLKDVVYVSSAGLRVLIDLHKMRKYSNLGELVLVNVPPRIFETLELAGFTPLFRFFPDVETAVRKS